MFEPIKAGLYITVKYKISTNTALCVNFVPILYAFRIDFGKNKRHEELISMA